MDGILDFITDYESGEATEDETLEGFAMLIRTGLAWTFQGHYGRVAASFIEDGLIDTEGNIL